VLLKLANPVAKPKTKTQAKAIFPTTTVALEDLADIAGIESPLSDLGIPTEDDKTNIPLVIILCVYFHPAFSASAF
jgi:hypothetical protein